MVGFENFLQEVDCQLGALLVDAEFRQVAPGLWNRCRGKDINVVEVQTHSIEKSFCVNLGIHYLRSDRASV